jgi:hypothetical protein
MKSKNEKHKVTTELHRELKQKGVVRQAKVQALVSKLDIIKATSLFLNKTLLGSSPKHPS